jgi:benzoate membrane transport protein
MSDPALREAALVTFAVSASGTTLAGVSSPFWGLLAGVGFLGLQRAGIRPTPGPPPSQVPRHAYSRTK